MSITMEMQDFYCPRNGNNHKDCWKITVPTKCCDRDVVISANYLGSSTLPNRLTAPCIHFQEYTGIWNDWVKRQSKYNVGDIVHSKVKYDPANKSWWLATGSDKDAIYDKNSVFVIVGKSIRNNPTFYLVKNVGSAEGVRWAEPISGVPGDEYELLSYSQQLALPPYIRHNGFCAAPRPTLIISNADVFWKEEIQMSESKSVDVASPGPASSFMATVTEDTVDVAYRLSAMKLVKVVQASLLIALKTQKVKKKYIAAIEAALETELGCAALSTGIGFGLKYFPMLKSNPRSLRLAREFRVGGMTTGANMVFGTFIDALTKSVLPVITETLAMLPDPDTKISNGVEVKEKAPATV